MPTMTPFGARFAAFAFQAGARSVVGSSGSGPAIVARISAQSSAVRASGPTVSSVNESGIALARLTRPLVGLKPLTPQTRAGGFEPGNRGRRRGRDPTFPDLRAAFGELALGVIHVLVRERHAVQRSLRLAARERAVRGLGGFQRILGLDAREGVQLRLPLVDAFEQRLGGFDRRHLAAADRGGEILQCQFCWIAHRPASLRCAAMNVAGSVSISSARFSAAKRVTVGAVARAMRAGDSGASGTRAAAAIVATRSGVTSSGMWHLPGGKPRPAVSRSRIDHMACRGVAVIARGEQRWTLRAA